MDNNITIRPIVAKEYQLVANLILSLYEINRPAEYFGAWQWSNGIFESILMGAFNDSELIGLAGVQRKKLANNKVFGYLTSLNIAAKWQGKGIFSRVTKEALSFYKDLDFFCVIVNPKAKAPIEHSLGFKIVGNIRAMILSDISRIGYQDSTCETISKNTDFTFIAGNQEKLMFCYTPEYRRWRYALHPQYYYDLVRLSSGEFAVIKMFVDPDNGAHIGDIVDFECSLNDGHKLKELYLATCGHLKKQGAERISTLALPDSELRSVVENIGFKEGNYDTYFAVKVLNPEYDFVYDFSRWHLRQSDGTLY